MLSAIKVASAVPFSANWGVSKYFKVKLKTDPVTVDLRINPSLHIGTIIWRFAITQKERR